MFIQPMLASPFPKGKKPFTINMPGEWCAQEKFDGHRMIIEIAGGKTNLFSEKSVTAWSRHGLKRTLPTHLVEELSKFPDVIMDGELFVPGSRSYGVTELVNGPDLIFCAFDLLQVDGLSIYGVEHDGRQDLLYEIFEELQLHDYSTDKTDKSPVQMAATYPVANLEEVAKLRDQMWAAGKEGLILKRRTGIYMPGKRSKDWVKVKDLQSALLTVVGFAASRGQINDRGPFAIVLLEDEDGNRTSVTTRGDANCRKFEEEARRGLTSIGRKLWIEFQERTPDGNYRHPRWDRWENE